MLRQVFSLGFCLLLAAALTAHPAEIAWTNTSGGSWNTAANWSPRQVPTEPDVALITNAGTYTVTLNVNPTIAGLILGSDTGTQTLATSGRTLTLNGDGLVGARGHLRLSGGALAGTNLLRLEGALTLESGTLNTHTALTVARGGQVTLASAGNSAKNVFGNLTNAGTVTWQPNGGFSLGGIFHNLSGALFEIQEDNISLVSSSTNAVLINEGVLRKSTNSGIINCRVPLIHHGTVETLGGTLALQEGGRFQPGCRFLGAGITRLDSGTHLWLGDLLSSNLVLYGATLVGDGTLRGKMIWADGTLGAGATLTVAPDAELLLQSSANRVKSILGHLTNAGTLRWQSYGNVLLGGTLHNLPGALFDVQVENRSINPADTNAVFRNDGLLRGSAGDSTVIFNTPLVNAGRLEIPAGTLVFNALTNATGVIVLAGGTLQMPQPFTLAGGHLTGWGLVRGDVINQAATLIPAEAGGELTLAGDYTQRIGATLALTLAGHQPGANQSRLKLTGKARFGGTLEVRLAPDYVPDPNVNFEVIAFASATGGFAACDGLYLLGHDRRLTPVFDPTRLTLLTMAAPDPTRVDLRVAVEGDTALISWPAEFQGGRLSFTPNLRAADWTPLPDVTHRHLESPLTSEKFFRLTFGPP